MPHAAAERSNAPTLQYKTERHFKPNLQQQQKGEDRAWYFVESDGWNNGYMLVEPDFGGQEALLG